MNVDRPIFLLGPGRSGSTLLNSLLTLHEDAGYFTSWSNRWPSLWWLAAGSRLRSPALEASGRRIRFYPGPTEAYAIWKALVPSFWTACRSPCDDPEIAARVRRHVERHLRVQGATRFVAKLTGPPMSEFFRSIFEDARFVWIDRDPRAVVYSYSRGRKVSIPEGLSGDEAEAEALRQSARRYLDIYDAWLEAADDRQLLLVYGDFVREPERQMRRLLAHCELDEDPRLLELTRRWHIRDADAKWRTRLSEANQELLEELVRRPLDRRRDES